MGCARAAVGISVAAGVMTVVFAQAPPATTTQDGVYTREQAARGRETYERTCSSCHGDDLSGGDKAPALSGDLFLSTWEHKTLRSLYRRILSTMPPDEPGTLSQEEVLNVVARLLQVNEFPAGERGFSAADDLNAISFVRPR